MKDIRLALRQFLLADTAIAAKVATRVFPLVMPQGTKETSIVYTRISGKSGHHMAGRDGLAFIRMQIDVWSPSSDEAAALANLIKDRLDGYKGQMGAGDAAVTVQGIFFADERENYDDAVKMHRMSRDYFIDFAEV